MPLRSRGNSPQKECCKCGWSGSRKKWLEHSPQPSGWEIKSLGIVPTALRLRSSLLCRRHSHISRLFNGNLLLESPQYSGQLGGVCIWCRWTTTSNLLPSSILESFSEVFPTRTYHHISSLVFTFSKKYSPRLKCIWTKSILQKIKWPTLCASRSSRCLCAPVWWWLGQDTPWTTMWVRKLDDIVCFLCQCARMLFLEASPQSESTTYPPSSHKNDLESKILDRGAP